MRRYGDLELYISDKMLFLGKEMVAMSKAENDREKPRSAVGTKDPRTDLMEVR